MEDESFNNVSSHSRRRLPSWIALDPEWPTSPSPVGVFPKPKNAAAAGSATAIHRDDKKAAPPPFSSSAHSPRSPARSRRRVASSTTTSPARVVLQHSNNPGAARPPSMEEKNDEYHVTPAAQLILFPAEALSSSDWLTTSRERVRATQDLPERMKVEKTKSEDEDNELEWERSFLLQLLRDSDSGEAVNWQCVWDRISYRPDVLRPVVNEERCVRRLKNPTNPNKNNTDDDDDDGTNNRCCTAPVYYEQTILGALCSVRRCHRSNPEKDVEFDTHSCTATTTSACTAATGTGSPVTILDVIQLVLDLRCDLVQCSQHAPGHIPLRDAVLNPTIETVVLEWLVQADPASVYTRDLVGLTPLDYLLQFSLHSGHDDNIGIETSSTTERLASLLKYAAIVPDQCYLKSSPLLALLSLQKSLIRSSASKRGFRLSNINGSELQHERRFSTGLETTGDCPHLLECVRLLLKWDPTLLSSRSLQTGCSSLHIAVRNHGTNMPLISELIQWDCSEKNGAGDNRFQTNNSNVTMMRHRNRYGDLVLHVACAVGVPIKVLQLIITKTRMAWENGEAIQGMVHSRVWTANASGYTPVDLEWIRHIEGGDGFYYHRTFISLDARGIRRLGGRCDALYNQLLRQAVDQVILNDNSSRNITNSLRAESAGTDTTTTPRISNGDALEGTIGLLLHRILLVVEASFENDYVDRQLHIGEPFPYILHQASALCGPCGSVLPRPILDLVLWQYPEQINRADSTGKLPLHYAVQIKRLSKEITAKAVQEWREWVVKLLNRFPDACQIEDKCHRLPLHYALSYQFALKPVADAGHVQEARDVIVRKMADLFPQSVETVDPVTKLYPFQLAAINSLLSIETQFHLLRMSPGIIVH